MFGTVIKVVDNYDDDFNPGPRGVEFVEFTQTFIVNKCETNIRKPKSIHVIQSPRVAL